MKDLQIKLDYIDDLFRQNVVPADAIQMKAYMKHHFDFYGVKSPVRKQLVSEYWSACKQMPDDDFKLLVNGLWDSGFRESQYFAQDILTKVLRHLDQSWIDVIESLILKKSWWDSVDYLAANPVGTLFKKYPELIDPYTEKWMSSDNMWLQRTCLIYQLKYKEDTDFDRLSGFIQALKGGNEFFINKAIGWSLRQYSKFDPDRVRSFIADNQDLSNLSIREGSKYLS